MIAQYFGEAISVGGMACLFRAETGKKSSFSGFYRFDKCGVVFQGGGNPCRRPKRKKSREKRRLSVTGTWPVSRDRKVSLFARLKNQLQTCCSLRPNPFLPAATCGSSETVPTAPARCEKSSTSVTKCSPDSARIFRRVRYVAP